MAAKKEQADQAPTPPKPPATWQTLIGHEKVERWFSAAIGNGRLSGSFLFVGSAGIGKRTIANLVARTVLCQQNPPDQMSPCGVCASCQQVVAHTHPDVIRVRKPAEKSFIPLEHLIGPPDARMQEGFCRDIRLKPFGGARKVAILEDADFLNEEGANCLLKTLEEPPSGAVIMLIGTSEQRQLPTIRSRCQILRLGPLPVADVKSLLAQKNDIQADEQSVSAAMEISGGDMNVIARLLGGQGDDLRLALANQLSVPAPDPSVLKRLITKAVDDAGKDASARRGRMRDVFSICVQHYRKRMREEAASNQINSATLRRVDRCVRALREVDRSANQSTLIECFSSDIAFAETGDRGEIG